MASTNNLSEEGEVLNYSSANPALQAASENEKTASPPKKGFRPFKASTSSTGLSELSKQLRVLQAKNHAQSTEIDRLERQLRILADLQNVSVADLRDALRTACQGEAHLELQNRVAFLTAQLEAAELVKQSTTKAPSSVDNQVANLQLRIGELEEVEENTRAEIQGLYKALTEQTTKATRLEATCAQQQAEIEATKESAGAASDLSEGQSDQVIETRQHAQVEELVEKEKYALLERQRSAAEKQYELRQAQFKARFAVQEENIHDLKQQLSSLYTAFDMLRLEREEEQKVNEALRAFLNEADAQVAQQTDHIEKHVSPVKLSTPPNSPQRAQREIMASPDQQKNRTPSSPGLVSPGTRGEQVMAGELLLRTSSGVVKRWKKRDASLYVQFAHHTLVYSGEGSVVKLPLTVGVSAVQPYNSTSQKFAFVVHTNAFDRSGRSIYAAAANEEAYERWMAALKIATVGLSEDDTLLLSEAPAGSRRQISAEEQEELDLKMALDLSEKEQYTSSLEK
jgi:hypothetical protein